MDTYHKWIMTSLTIGQRVLRTVENGWVCGLDMMGCGSVRYAMWWDNCRVGWDWGLVSRRGGLVGVFCTE